ncbi:hypothetical protein DL771_006323 [Monosporascus sp. 5C6A]|nr:hypothetical protein DL771_006323 [Monosporascus sp. 5C6A]
MGEAELYPLLNTRGPNGRPLRRRGQSKRSGQKTGVGSNTSRIIGVADNLSSNWASEKAPSGHPRTVFERRRRRSSILRQCRRYAVKHTWVFPLVFLLILLSLYALNPTESNVLHRFIFLSYELPSDGMSPQYGKGPWDIAFVSFYAVVLAFTREFVTQEILRPLARRYGLKSRGKQARFMEQAYTAFYFSFLGPAGLYLMRRTPVWYFNTRGMYESFPHKTHEAGFKFYYLFQAAYWLHQAVVMLLGLEKPRKDFKELVAHHIVTLALIGLSYRFHFTYMGIAVYTTHDISDWFLAVSKSLNYIRSPIVGPFYGVFICVWTYLRHYQNLRIIASLLTEFRSVGPYELNWETEQYKCLLSNVITFVLLAALQLLNLFWIYYILRSGYRYAVHNIAKDDRSEESEVEEMERKNEAIQSLTGTDTLRHRSTNTTYASG